MIHHILAQAADGASQAAQQGLDPNWVTGFVTSVVGAVIGGIGTWFYRGRKNTGTVDVKGDVRVSNGSGNGFMRPEDCKNAHAGFENRLAAVEDELRDFRQEMTKSFETERLQAKADQNNVYHRVNAISTSTAELKGLVSAMNASVNMLLAIATGKKPGGHS